MRLITTYKLTNSKQPSIWQVILSVLAAMFGVQSEKTRTRDFKHGDPKIFIITGIVLGLLFVLTLIALVKIVIAYSI